MKRDINKLAKKLRKELREDILNRYDNVEYWVMGNIVDNFISDNQVSKEEEEKLYKIIVL
jgi:hypothetical protein